ncbi:MAG: adenylate/guanylate cyclase domain-containing protein [Leptospiraceae bacterium]|nr:adenylate/guanylate cyclase domain-containing protein [Leptospiraceae bacterium]
MIGRVKALLSKTNLGIREKLALFTASLIFVTIFLFTYSAVEQQSRIISENYERLASLSRRHVSSLVREINNMARNLIQIEEFRRQLEEQQKIRKAYRAQKVVVEEKELNLGFFKTNLFGILGKKEKKYQVETFYSRYLSDSEVKAFENKVKAEVEKTVGSTLTGRQWDELKQLSMRLAQENKAERIIKLRSELDQKLSLLLFPTYRRVMEEIGLEKNLFRIQTFPVTALENTTTLLPSFDTRLVFPEAKLSSLPDIAEFEQSLRETYARIVDQGSLDFSKTHVRLRHGDFYLHAFYSPLFEKPVSTSLAQVLLNLREYASYFAQFEKDRQICQNLKEISDKLRTRLKFLRDRKVAPYLDKEFRQLYGEYDRLIKQRQEIWQKVTGFSQEKEEFKLHEVALLYLRDFFVEENLLLYYSRREEGVDEFLIKPANLKNRVERLGQLRKWIMQAQSELAPAYLQRLYPEALIGKSRSEIEEILWDYDSTPFFDNGVFVLPRLILKANLTSLMRTIVDESEGLLLVRKNRNKVLVNALILGVFAIFLAVYSSGLVVQKIRRIIQSAQRVGQGDLSVVFEHGGRDEFGSLTDALNTMVSGLREREKIKGILGTMIDPVVVQEAMKDLAALKRGAEKEVTAFFSDVASFSTISEKLSPPQLASLLNEYLSEMTVILKKHGGVLDKYIGDAIVGIFNSPLDLEDHTYKAVLASLEMVARLKDLRQKWKEQDSYIPEVHEMKMRIGLNTGLAKVGLMGTDAISSYTMMGDTVNLAARLEAAAKDYGVYILISEAVYERIRERIFCRKLDLVRVKGKKNPVALYEVICKVGEESPQLQHFTKAYEEALELYFQRQWEVAARKFQDADKISGSKDLACQLLYERCQFYLENPPPPDWDGVYTRTTK